MEILKLSLLLGIVASCHGGDVTVSYAPSSLRFVRANTLRSSSLDDMLAVAMGYTPQTTSPWGGLAITSPFSSPVAAIVVGIDGSGSDVPQVGHRYPLQEDQSLTKMFDSLNATVSYGAQRPTHFVVMEVADEPTGEPAAVSAQSGLRQNKEPDASFLREVAALPKLINKLKEETSVPHGGQDFVLFQVESFSLLVKMYGDDSAQVREGKQLLSTAIDRLVSSARQLYADNVLVVAVVMDKSALALTRRTRAAGDEPQVADLNLADEYSVDYPAYFAIVLFLGIVLAIAVLAASVATAYMDPGRDSIIYRMTNPRMKKDQ